MQHADATTVLGDFEETSFSSPEVSARFFTRDGRYFVQTAGADGESHAYAVAYTFGADPLQQYLIAGPRGRLQALTLAWDTRPKSDGGQRWFDLVEGQNVRAGDSLHWTGRDQNWNFMCASCHSTNLERNYNLVADSYATTWSELNVSCEACHGPGAQHVAWARAPRGRVGAAEGGTRSAADGSSRSAADGSSQGAADGSSRGAADGGKGLVRTRSVTRAGAWGLVGDRPIASWLGPARSQSEVEACAPCHARRRELRDHIDPARPFLDSYMPAGLDDAQYYEVDGQVRGEVFEYGSFLQSKMFAAGVSCSDCHDPHSSELKRPQANNTCTSCHRPSVFDTTEHHHHTSGTAAASCITCHMPQRTFMQVDKRRDHSFRIPHPEAPDTPNACSTCHTDQPDQSLAATIASWRTQRISQTSARGADPRPAAAPALAAVSVDEQRHAQPLAAPTLSPQPQTPAIAAGRAGDRPAQAQPSAAPMFPLQPQTSAIAAGRAGARPAQALLLEVADEPRRPAIVRAAALTLLSNNTTGTAPTMLPVLSRAIGDSDPLVRMAAARTLEALPPSAAHRLGAGLLSDPIAAVRIEAARALLDAMPLANEPARAEQQLTNAVRELFDAELASAERPESHLNLSTFYLRMSRPDDAATELRTALRLDPRFTPALVGLADLSAQRGDLAQAQQLLRTALTHAPDDAAAHFALGLVHARAGDTDAAREQLAAATALQPTDARYAYTYALALRESGRFDEARSVLVQA
jgi:tetratricopeptide (TPR) repeat protein